MLHYCKKCGRIIFFILDKEDKICDCCKNKVFPVPNEYLKGEFAIQENSKQEFMDKYVKTSPEFDQYLFDHRDEILAKQNAEFNARMEIGKAIKEGRKVTKEELLSGRLNESSECAVVTCPYCKSTNTDKITITSKAVNTAVFGIFGTKRHKQWHCNNCKSDF